MLRFYNKILDAHGKVIYPKDTIVWIYWITTANPKMHIPYQ